MVTEKGVRDEQHAWGTEPALGRFVRHEGALQRMESLLGAQPFDRRHRAAAHLENPLQSFPPHAIRQVTADGEQPFEVDTSAAPPAIAAVALRMRDSVPYPNTQFTISTTTAVSLCGGGNGPGVVAAFEVPRRSGFFNVPRKPPGCRVPLIGRRSCP